MWYLEVSFELRKDLEQEKQMSNEKNPGCLGHVGIILPSCMEI